MTRKEMNMEELKPHAGLLLDVYVKSYIGEKPEGGDLTRDHGRLTLMGVVDFDAPPEEPEEEPDYSADPKPREPKVTLLSSELWQAVPTEEAPACWLVKKNDKRYIVPAYPVSNLPNLEYTKPGGHFVATREGGFWLLLDTEFHGAVPVHDLKGADRPPRLISTSVPEGLAQ